MMRVTFTQINNNLQRNIMTNFSRIAELQEQLSTGRRLNRPSDAPVDMKNNLNLKAELAQGNQYKQLKKPLPQRLNCLLQSSKV